MYGPEAYIIRQQDKREINWSVTHDIKDRLQERREQLGRASPQGLIVDEALRAWYGMPPSPFVQVVDDIAKEVGLKTTSYNLAQSDITKEDWRGPNKARVHTHISADAYEKVDEENPDRGKGYALTQALDAYLSHDTNRVAKALDTLENVRDELQDSDEYQYESLEVDSEIELDPDEIDSDNIKQTPDARAPVLAAVARHKSDVPDDRILAMQDDTDGIDRDQLITLAKDMFNCSDPTAKKYADYVMDNTMFNMQNLYGGFVADTGVDVDNVIFYNDGLHCLYVSRMLGRLDKDLKLQELLEKLKEMKTELPEDVLNISNSPTIGEVIDNKIKNIEEQIEEGEHIRNEVVEELEEIGDVGKGNAKVRDGVVDVCMEQDNPVDAAIRIRLEYDVQNIMTVRESDAREILESDSDETDDETDETGETDE